ncbi:unnamed protein product [Rotaria magnacalcarata]|uniref:Uncharacterized protein n=1 Tax=Rotaria magnacalcarata TaxID=392030 RepID=A0A815V7E8_9BILA|nr:unnamed protein product [Rotaria magnacalcarata]
MEKQNKFNQYDDIIFASEEYKRWMLHPFDENGKRIPFQGVKHCTDDDACQCKKYRLNISMLTIDRPYNFGGDWHYNDRTTPSPSTINDEICECIIRRDAILPGVDRKIELLLYLGIPIIIVVFWLLQIIHWIYSKYCWNEDEQQTENLQQDSKHLKEVIIHKDEPEDLSVVINPKMKLLATI